MNQFIQPVDVMPSEQGEKSGYMVYCTCVYGGNIGALTGIKQYKNSTWRERKHYSELLVNLITKNEIIISPNCIVSKPTHAYSNGIIIIEELINRTLGEHDQIEIDIGEKWFRINKKRAFHYANYALALGLLSEILANNARDTGCRTALFELDTLPGDQRSGYEIPGYRFIEDIMKKSKTINELIDVAKKTHCMDEINIIPSRDKNSLRASIVDWIAQSFNAAINVKEFEDNIKKDVSKRRIQMEKIAFAIKDQIGRLGQNSDLIIIPLPKLKSLK